MSHSVTEFHILPNGLRVVAMHTRANAGIFGVAVNAGSRDESPCHHGLAHFVEHTIFKGTLRRRACHILNRMETVGGELNAFTSKEETNVYSIFPGGNPARAAELIADLLRNSRFPAAELRKESEVVKEEIDSYLDTPSEAVFDDFENLLFAGSQLGHNILGDSANLPLFTPELCRSYIAGNYTTGRMVVFYRGSWPAAKVIDTVSRYFGDMEACGSQPLRIAPQEVEPFATTRTDAGSHQAHTVIGAMLPGIHDPRRHALGLLTNILGGPGMNSRLNVALREKRGLVYAVDASLNLLSDCGNIAIYFGCDPDDTRRCTDLTLTELHKLATTPLTPRALAAAKRQYLGQLTVAVDNTESSALQTARTALYFSRIPDRKATIDTIESLSADDLLAAAALLSPDRMSRLTLS